MVATFTVALPLVCFAQDEEEELTWYAVEIIVFERTSEIERNAEAWPYEPGLPDLADAVELSREGFTLEELAGTATAESRDEASDGTPDEAPAGTGVAPTPLIPLPRAFQLVPEAEYRLTDARKRLDKSSAYRPLLHIGWIQPGYPSEQARLVHVRNSNATLGTVDVSVGEKVEEGVEAPLVADDPGFEATLSPRITVARDPSRAALDGTLRMHRARYLHIEADLLYYRPLDGDASAAPANAADATTVIDSPDTALIEQLLAEDDRAPRLFRLTERRRMRSRELHYLDHPLFGMLVAAWPLELPEMPVEPAQPMESDAPPAAEGESTATEPAQTGSGG
jgi:hypothetical protein